MREKEREREREREREGERGGGGLDRQRITLRQEMRQQVQFIGNWKEKWCKTIKKQVNNTRYRWPDRQAAKMEELNRINSQLQIKRINKKKNQSKYSLYVLSIGEDISKNLTPNYLMRKECIDNCEKELEGGMRERER